MSKLKKPPKKSIDEFISEPEVDIKKKPSETLVKSGSYPWEGKNEKVMKGLNLRFTEVQYEKLKFVYEHSTEKSLQKYIMSVLEPEVDKRIKELTGVCKR